jgi:ubiquitin carboxyl-terminal hydrolase L3
MARWIPLESNPEVLTKYTRALGAQKGTWVDVFALDDESLAGIPPPVLAVILLFPISEQYDQYCKEQDELVKEKDQEIPNIFYMKQVVGNACGTVGIIHALANNAEAVQLEDGILKEFMTETAGMTPEERGQALANSEKLAQAHEKIAEEGQTAAPDPEERLVTHFVALIHKDGHLYELDGRRARVGPINHGPTNPENLLKDAAKVCQSHMARDPTEYRFTVVALTTAPV